MNTVIAFSFCLVMALAVMTQANSDPEALRDDTNQLQADTGLFEASEDVAELRKREDQNPEGRRGKLESVEGDNKKKSKSPRKPEGMNKKKKNDKKPRKLKTKKKNNNGKVPRKLKTKKKNDKGPRKLKTKKNNGKGLRKLKTKKNNGKGPRKLKNNNGKGPRKLKKKGENTRTMNRKPKKNRKPIELRGRPSKTKKLERTHKLPEIFKLPKIKNRKNLKGVNVRDDTNNKRECKPKRKCNALSGECRQKSSGCNAGEVEATGKGKFCSKSTCVCCYTDDGSCANTKKCDKKGGTCQASDSGCAKFKTGTKWCSGTGCGCCFGGTSTCKAKKKCKNMNGVCQSSSATCSGAVYTKGFCKGGSDCVCCVKEDDSSEDHGSHGDDDDQTDEDIHSIEDDHNDGHDDDSDEHDGDEDEGGHGDMMWSYEGDIGPNHWSQTFPFCGGTRQSPLDLEAAFNVTGGQDMTPIQCHHYNDTPISVTIMNNGHTIIMKPEMKHAAFIVQGGLSSQYQLLQLHFHWGKNVSAGSEHAINHHSYPCEMHLVHYKTEYGSLGEAIMHDDGLAVLGVMFEISYEDNPLLEPLCDALEQVTEPGSTAQLAEPIPLSTFIPWDSLGKFYRYLGSLTTPPCNEIVVWTIFNDELYISERQLEKFRGLNNVYGQSLGDNYRPVQAYDDRQVGWFDLA